MFTGEAGNLIEIEAVGIAGDTVGDEVIEHAGDVQLHAVREMTAVGEVETEDGVTGLDRGKIDSEIGLTAGVRLHVDVLGAEKLLGAVAGEVFDLVDKLATAVIATAGIAFGIFVGKHAAGSLHDGGADVVFASDEFEAIVLASSFLVYSGPDSGIVLFNEVHG